MPLQDFNEQRIAKHKQFLQKNGELIAAFAWERWQKEGRGAVCFFEEDFVHLKIPGFKSIDLRYPAENSEDLKSAGGWPGDKVQNWVLTYDPTKLAVVLVVRKSGGSPSGYLIGGPQTPPEAFAARKADEN